MAEIIKIEQADVLVTLRISGKTLGRIVGILGHHSPYTHKEVGVPGELADVSHEVYEEVLSICTAAGIATDDYYDGKLA